MDWKIERDIMQKPFQVQLTLVDNEHWKWQNVRTLTEVKKWD